MAKRPDIVYTYRGHTERGTATPRNPRPGYRWHDGYSETTPDGAVLYPWLTRSECRADAAARGAVARFEHPAGALRPAIS